MLPFFKNSRKNVAPATQTESSGYVLVDNEGALEASSTGDFILVEQGDAGTQKNLAYDLKKIDDDPNVSVSEPICDNAPKYCADDLSTNQDIQTFAGQDNISTSLQSNRSAVANLLADSKYSIGPFDKPPKAFASAQAHEAISDFDEATLDYSANSIEKAFDKPANKDSDDVNSHSKVCISGAGPTIRGSAQEVADINLQDIVDPQSDIQEVTAQTSTVTISQPIEKLHKADGETVGSDFPDGLTEARTRHMAFCQNIATTVQLHDTLLHEIYVSDISADNIEKLVENAVASITAAFSQRHPDTQYKYSEVGKMLLGLHDNALHKLCNARDETLFNGIKRVSSKTLDLLQSESVKIRLILPAIDSKVTFLQGFTTFLMLHDNSVDKLFNAENSALIKAVEDISQRTLNLLAIEIFAPIQTNQIHELVKITQRLHDNALHKLCYAENQEKLVAISRIAEKTLQLMEAQIKPNDLLSLDKDQKHKIGCLVINCTDQYLDKSVKCLLEDLERKEKQSKAREAVAEFIGDRSSQNADESQFGIITKISKKSLTIIKTLLTQKQFCEQRCEKIPQLKNFQTKIITNFTSKIESIEEYSVEKEMKCLNEVSNLACACIKMLIGEDAESMS